MVCSRARGSLRYRNLRCGSSVPTEKSSGRCGFSPAVVVSTLAKEGYVPVSLSLNTRCFGHRWIVRQVQDGSKSVSFGTQSDSIYYRR